jgi:hypothetical protein
MMKAARTSETMVNFYQTPRRSQKTAILAELLAFGLLCSDYLARDAVKS